jgi:hypothetical protein
MGIINATKSAANFGANCFSCGQYRAARAIHSQARRHEAQHITIHPNGSFSVIKEKQAVFTSTAVYPILWRIRNGTEIEQPMQLSNTASSWQIARALKAMQAMFDDCSRKPSTQAFLHLRTQTSSSRESCTRSSMHAAWTIRSFAKSTLLSTLIYAIVYWATEEHSETLMGMLFILSCATAFYVALNAKQGLKYHAATLPNQWHAALEKYF